MGIILKMVNQWLKHWKIKRTEEMGEKKKTGMENCGGIGRDRGQFTKSSTNNQEEGTRENILGVGNGAFNREKRVRTCCMRENLGENRVRETPSSGVKGR